MTQQKHDATYHPGQQPVYPMPGQPFETLAAWGRTDEIPPPDDVLEGYTRPPALAPQRSGLPAWAWVSIILGGLFIMCSGLLIAGIFGSTEPKTVAPTSGIGFGTTAAGTARAVPSVSTLGTCEKKIIGEYGLVATVTALNLTDKPQTGQVWVSWPVTGEAPARFVKTVTLKPGQYVDFPVNHDVNADSWFRTGQCTYGWDPS